MRCLTDIFDSQFYKIAHDLNLGKVVLKRMTMTLCCGMNCYDVKCPVVIINLQVIMKGRRYEMNVVLKGLCRPIAPFS